MQTDSPIFLIVAVAILAIVFFGLSILIFLSAIHDQFSKIMKSIDRLTSAVGGLETQAGLTVTAINDLRTAVANGNPDTNPDLEALSSRVENVVATLKVAVNPPPPAAPADQAS